MAQVLASVLYYAPFKATELNPNYLKFIPVDRQKQDLSKDVYLLYHKF